MDEGEDDGDEDAAAESRGVVEVTGIEEVE